ncbi:MAG: hypothetical protein BMS9Abin29_0754 [Gemmatimonadota bacterium]|nr:MAG: hypothetical protein BMS9Abin29_0754 [Gemmatimonadota bacterium]
MIIYLDTSVVLAHLLAEDRRPPAELWSEELVASRILEYELWTRIHARGLARSHSDAARLSLARIAFLELGRSVLARALQPFPVEVRTRDALHLASASFLRERGHDVRVASYDARLIVAAESIGLEVMEL